MSKKMMQGFPPAADQQVHLGNWRTPPFNRWAFSHVSEIVPSALIGNHSEAVAVLPENQQDIESFVLENKGSRLSLQDWLAQTYTDGIVILKNGVIVYEQYFGELKRTTPHILMSVSKSLTAFAVGVLVGQGRLSPDDEVAHIIPEIQGTAYAGATVRDLLDMRVGVAFDENYLATEGTIIEYRKAQNWNPIEPNDVVCNLREFFSLLQESDGSHNQRFHYVSPNTDLLGWIVERCAGQRFADFFSEYIWQPLGAEQPAYITVDRVGAPRCAGGICTTVRDLARLGRLFVHGGQVGGIAVIPAAWLDDILNADTREAWDMGDFYDFYHQAPIHYRSQWYVEHGVHKMVFGMGVFGQHLFVEPDSDLVIAKLSSQPLPLDQYFNTLTHQGIDVLRSLLR